MSKRRAVGPGADDDEGDEKKPAKETRAQREARRQQEERARTKRAHRHEGFLSNRPRWQVYAIMIGAAAAVLILIGAVAVFAFNGACLTLNAPPATSGAPDENNPSWCSNSSNYVYHIYVKLEIVIAGSYVTIPGAIGENVDPIKYGFPCTMPLFTDNSTGTGGGTSGGIIQIGSDWDFNYTLGQFFSIWQESDTNAQVNGASTGIAYTETNGVQTIFNYTNTANQVVRLIVDGQVNTAGPNLDLSALPNYPASESQPGCLVDHEGSGHVIEITWGWRGAAAAVPIFTPPGGTVYSAHAQSVELIGSTPSASLPGQAATVLVASGRSR